MEPGTQLGPYRVEGLLGEGGMGQVYRGVDTRLGRSVAIKVLPPRLASHPGLRERFEREARAISSLSHPHICTLFDVGLQDGVDYLVMEYLEGETLADRLLRGPLPLPDAIRHGREIAGALAKAHRQGLVHRDLKPGNVMITKAGAKLLDFGLAKAFTAPSPADAPTELGRPLTEEGTVLGTFQYMSPEQLEGLDADGRSDLFALGAVLYEMVTGRRAFEGRTRTSLIAAIVAGEPRPLGELQPMTPPALEHVVDRCLRKDPDERWQSAADVAEELRWIGEEGAGRGPAPSAAAPGRRARRALAAAGLLAAGLAAGFAASFLRVGAEPQALVQSSLVLPNGLEFLPTGENDRVALSPDGRAVAFTGRDDAGRPVLWVRRLDEIEARALPATQGARDPFWAPDGRRLAFFSDGKLRTVGLDGSPPVAVCDVASNPLAGAWSRDGHLVFSPASGAALHRVAAAGGKATAITRLDAEAGETTHRWPRLLPDGRSYLYLAGGHELAQSSEVNALYAARLDSTERKLVLRVRSNVDYVDGHLLFVRNGALLAQRLDPARLEVEGEPIEVARNVHYNANSFYSAFSAAPGGALVYAPADARSRQLVWLDTSGRQTGVLGSADTYRVLSLSPDRGTLALEIEDPSTGYDVWLMELASGRLRRLTLRGSGSFPAWSPDGRRVAYVGEGNGLYVEDAGGQGEPEKLWGGNERWGGPTGWSPDGRHLAVWRFDPATATGYDAFVLSLEGARALVPVATTEAAEFPLGFSGDGRWLLYESDASGRNEVYLASFPDLRRRVQVSLAGGAAASWSGPREIWYRLPDGTWVAVGLEERVGMPLQLSPPRVLLRDPELLWLEPSAEGDRILALRERAEEAVPQIVLVNDWRRLPRPAAR